MVKRYLVLELELSKDIPDLADKIAGRVYVLDGVEDVNVVTHAGDYGPLLVAIAEEVVRQK